MENFEIQKKSMIKKLNPGMIMYIFIIIMIIIMIIGIIVFLVYENLIYILQFNLEKIGQFL